MRAIVQQLLDQCSAQATAGAGQPDTAWNVHCVLLVGEKIRHLIMAGIGFHTMRQIFEGL
ncbi:hypothetical protein D3C71_2015940 [compost metagenome]